MSQSLALLALSGYTVYALFTQTPEPGGFVRPYLWFVFHPCVVTFMALSSGTFDAINASWEIFATLVNLTNIRSILKHRTVKGVNIWGTSYYLMWGAWNIFWFSHLSQRISWYAAYGMLITNLIWFSLALYFKYKHLVMKGEPDASQPASPA